MSTGAGTHTYQWDAEGRLISVDGGATANIVYNALGQRAERNYVGHAYPYREYVYDGFGNNIGEHKRDAWYYRSFPLGFTPLAKHAGGTTGGIHCMTIGGCIPRPPTQPTGGGGGGEDGTKPPPPPPPPGAPWDLITPPACSDVFSLDGQDLVVTSDFWKLRDSGPHGGMDFRAAEGTLLRTERDVKFVGEESGSRGSFGNVLTVEGNYDQRYVYGHLNTTPGFVPGQTIHRGLPMGTTGNTGSASQAPHLHTGRHQGTVFTAKQQRRDNLLRPCVQ